MDHDLWHDQHLRDILYLVLIFVFIYIAQRLK